MIVEHTFVTTMEQREALRAASSFLSTLGFRVKEQQPAILTMRRGRERANAYLAINELPQTIQLEFDRGRVSVGAGVTEVGKPTALHTDLLMAIVRGLEEVLVHWQPFDQSHQAIYAVEERIRIHAAKKRRHRNGCLLAVVLFIVVVTVLIIIAATR